MYSAFITRISFLTCLILAALAAPATPARSPYPLSPLTGPVLDYDEIRRYGLAGLIHADFWTLDSIRIFAAGSSYELEIYDRETGLRRMQLPAGEVAQLRQQVEAAEQPLLQQLASLRAALAGGPVLSQIVLRSQKVLVVPVLAASETHLSLSMPGGGQPLALERIESIELRGHVAPAARAFEDPVGERYFHARSAIPQGRGKGYVQNTMLLSATASYGLTNSLDLTVSTEVASILLITSEGLGLNDTEFPWLVSSATLKYGWQLAPRWHAGAGVTAFGNLGGGPRHNGRNGINLTPGAFGIATYGGAEGHLSLRAGLAFGNDRGVFDDVGAVSPVLMIGGMKRIGNHFALLGETWMQSNRRISGLPGEPGTQYFVTNSHALMMGVRVMSRRLAADVGLLGTREMKFMRQHGETQPELTGAYPIIPFVAPQLSVSYGF